MTDCSNGGMRDLLPDLVHERLDERERARVDAHVRDCASCTAEVELLASMRRAMRYSPPLDVASIAQRAIASARVQGRARRSRGPWILAAGVALAAGISALVVQRPSTSPRSTAAPVAVHSEVPAAIASGRSEPAAAPAAVARRPEPGTPGVEAARLADAATFEGVDDETLDRLLSDIDGMKAVVGDADAPAPAVSGAPVRDSQ